jgi:hypothetical protein
MKKYIEGCLLILFGLLCAVFISETVLRIIYPLPQRKSIYEFNPVRGSEIIPGIEYFSFNDVLEFKTKVKINSWGLRDDNIDYSQTDKKIILALGDSYTYGHEVNRDETFVEILQRKLSSTLGQDIEVVNAGVRGYSTAQEFLYYKELSQRGLSADLVMLWFSTNDILDNLCLDPHMSKIRPCFQIVDNNLKLTRLPEDPRVRNPSGAQERTRPDGLTASGGSGSWISSVRELRLYKLIYAKLRHVGMNYPQIISFLNSVGLDLKPVRTPSIIEGWYTDKSSSGWPLTKKIIQELNDEVKKDGGKLVVVLVPHSLQYSQKKQEIIKSILPVRPVEQFIQDASKPQRLLSSFCKENDIFVIDLLPGFEYALRRHTKEKGSPFDFPYDGHLNTEGHRLAADIVHQQIIENRKIFGIFNDKSGS